MESNLGLTWQSPLPTPAFPSAKIPLCADSAEGSLGGGTCSVKTRYVAGQLGCVTHPKPGLPNPLLALCQTLPIDTQAHPASAP